MKRKGAKISRYGLKVIDMLMSFGYARVSTRDQNIERQVAGIKGYRPDIPEANIFIDKKSGKGSLTDRDEYVRLKGIVEYTLSLIKPDDRVEIIIHELDRLGRNKRAVKEELAYWRNRGVLVRILNIPTTLLDTDSETGWVLDMITNVLIEVYASIAEEEIDTRHKRQMEGQEQARLKGVRFGRPSIEYEQDKFNELYDEWKSGKITAKVFMDTIGLKRGTFYRRVKDYEETKLQKIL